MSHTQWLLIRSLLDACSGLRVGKDAQSWRGSVAREGTEGRAWPPAYARGNRSMAVGGRVPPGRLARLRAYLQAKPDRSAVRLDSPIVRARERGGRAQEPRGGARTGSQPGRLRHPDPQPGGSAGPSPARDGRPAPRPYPGPGLGEDGTDVPCLGPMTVTVAAPVGATGHRGRLSGPTRAHPPPAPRPGTVPGAQGRGTGPRRAPTRAPRGHPLRPIRATVSGFPVLGRSLALAAILNPPALGCRWRALSRWVNVLAALRGIQITLDVRNRAP